MFESPQTRSDFVPSAARQSLLVEEVNGELVVYDQDRGAAHLLNRVAAFVWRHCDGRTTVAQLAALLQDELGLPANDDVVLLALDDLENNHLLEDRQPASTTPRFSRRHAVKRAATAAGIGLSLPLIESLNAPPARAAASPPHNASKVVALKPTRNTTF